MNLPVILAACLTLLHPPSEPLRVASFELPDQFGAVHNISFPRTNLLLLAVAGRKNSEQVDSWVRPVKARYTNSIAINGIADVSAVPGFLKSAIRAKFKDKFAHPVMLDWEGKIAPNLAHNESASVLLVQTNGTVVFQAAGKANSAALQRCFDAIDKNTPP